MAEVVGHVVAAERQHGERVTAHVAGRTDRGGSGFRAEGGGQVDTEVPVERLVDQRDSVFAATTEDHRAERDPLGIFPIRVDRRALARR